MTVSGSINHVALTVDAALLDGQRREALKDFYGQVFGWEEIPQLTSDGKRLVFRLYRRGQFVFLVSGPRPSELNRPDHFGIEVPTKAMLEEVVERARAYQRERDPAVEIDEIQVNTETDQLRLWNAYVRYLLPLRVELQYYEDKAPAS